MKHNLTGTRLHTIWCQMKTRCTNPKQGVYKYYGARGICVCEEWGCKKTGFQTFYTWAMANGYSETLTLDRINPNGNYEPTNCRWATLEQQNQNRRSPKLYCSNKSGTRGVFYSASNKSWVATSSASGSRKYLRMSKNKAVAEAALAAYEAQFPKT